MCKRLLLLLTLATPFATAASAMDTDSVVGLIAKINPQNLEGNNPQGYARTIFCHELAGANSDFDLHDAVQRVTTHMKALAQKANPRLEGLTRTFQFYQYDFNKQTLQINRGDYDWARTVPVTNLLDSRNRGCWQNPGHMMGMPNVVEALPDWKKIPFVFNIPQQDARGWFQGGPPTAALTVSITADKFMLEPMASPKLIFKGETTEWELVVFNGMGEEVRRLQSSPTAQSTSQQGNVSALGQREAVDIANVRAEPSTQSAILTKIAPGDRLTVQKQTDDAQWSYVVTPDDAAGWINTPVLLRTTRALGAPNTTAALPSSHLQPDDLKQKIMFLITGLESPPYTEQEEFHNALGTHIKTVTHTFEPTFEAPCVVTYKYTNITKDHTADKSFLGNYTSLRRFDFTKMTRITASYTEQPEEGLWWAFAGGPSNPRLPKPRFVTLVDYFGDDASCSLKDDGTNGNCSKASQSNGNFPYPSPSKRPKHFLDTFKAVKAACQ